MTRKTILNQLKKDLQDNLHSSKGYNTDPVEIIEGIVSFYSVLQRPTVAYFMFSDNIIEEHLDNERERELNLLVYGYADVSLGDFDPIYDLADDIESFLYSTDWSYTDQSMLGTMNVIVGGIENDQAMCDLTIKIRYTQTL